MPPDEKEPNQPDSQDINIGTDVTPDLDTPTTAEPTVSAPSDDSVTSPAVIPDNSPAEPTVPVVGSDASSTTPSPTSFDNTSGPTVSASTPAPFEPGKSKRKRWLWPAVVIVVVVILLAIGYVFAIYLPNTPGNVYKSSLTNTGKAVDKLVDYTKQESKAGYKSYSLSGTLNFKSAGASYDASLSGAFDKDKNGQLNVKADVVGQHITADLRTVAAKNSSFPDIYVKLGGLKQILDAYGVSGVDGQWVAIDHTILDSYGKQLAVVGSKENKAPTIAQLDDAIAKVQTVNKQYLFTTDSSKAVLINEKYVGTETKDGRSVNHYKVGYNKAHLQAYVEALKSALDSSDLNTYSKQANDGKSLSQTMDFKSLEDSIKNAKADYKFDLWADKGTKLISSIKFTDTKDSSSSFTISQSYTGGDVYPLSLNVTTKDVQATVDMKINTKTHNYTFGVDAKEGDKTSMTMNLTVTPSSKSVDVTVPKDAVPVTTLLQQLSGGSSTGVLGDSTTQPAILSGL